MTLVGVFSSCCGFGDDEEIEEDGDADVHDGAVTVYMIGGSCLLFRGNLRESNVKVCCGLKDMLLPKIMKIVYTSRCG